LYSLIQALIESNYVLARGAVGCGKLRERRVFLRGGRYRAAEHGKPARM
jgi:hypothetical protein